MRSSWTATRAGWIGVAAVAVVVLMLLACSEEEAPLKSVTFMAGFKPQANLPFAAAYVAKEKGYFREQGLDVEIRHSTGEHLSLLMAGDVHFTTADANSVLQRRADPGLPIVGDCALRSTRPAGLCRAGRVRHPDSQGLGGPNVRVQGVGAS